MTPCGCMEPIAPNGFATAMDTLHPRPGSHTINPTLPHATCCLCCHGQSDRVWTDPDDGETWPGLTDYTFFGTVPDTVKVDVTPSPLPCFYLGPVCEGGVMGGLDGQIVAVHPDVDKINPYDLAGDEWLHKHMELCCEITPGQQPFCGGRR